MSTSISLGCKGYFLAMLRYLLQLKSSTEQENSMSNVILSILATLSAIAVTLVTSALIALIFHFLWPYGIPHLYPSLVQNGYIPAEVSWIAAFSTFEAVGIIRMVLRGE
jgi:hypothetical protein